MEDKKEPAPIGAVAKVIGGISLALISVVLIGFAFAFDGARAFLLSLVNEMLTEVMIGGATVVLMPFVSKYWQARGKRKEGEKLQ